MGRICKLPTQVVNQIAAGEVIERPAAVLKELVENALDAGAGRVEIHVEQGGVRRIRVIDDGLGILPEDLPLAFTSHATSKIAEVEDLEEVITLGFRGEALPSIGAVAHCRIRSRVAGAEHGAELRCDGGVLGAVTPAGAPVGTTVEVENLFHNTPVRRRFLKSPATELGRITEMVTRLSLSHPEVGFLLLHDGREVLNLPPGQELADRIGALFGSSLQQDLLPVAHVEDDMRLEGFVLPLSHSRRDRSGIFFFLRGRYVRDRVLLSAVDRGYHELLPRGRHPLVFLHLAVSPREVDVNVHPTKTEVRFRSPGRVHTMVGRAIAAAVRVPEASPPAVQDGARAPGGDAAPARGLTGTLGLRERPAPVSLEPGVAPRIPVEATGLAEAPGRAFQLHRAFLVEECEDGIAIIDQHALHERILTTQLRDRIRSATLPSQRLLTPVVVTLPPGEVALVLELGEQLRRLGLDLERMGEDALAVHGLPVLLASRLGEEQVRQLVTDLVALARREDRTRAVDSTGLLDQVIHSMACRAAVKQGDPLSATEIQALLRLRDQLPGGGLSCAHGRPTTLRLTRAELERRFGRH